MSSHASSDLPDDSDIFQLIMHELTQRANAMQDNLGQPIAIQMALDIFRSYPTMLRSILQQTEKFRQRDFYRNLLKSVLDDIHKQSAAVLAEHYRNIGVGDASSITTAAILCRRLCSSSLPTEPSTWPRYIDVASAEILADERAIIDRAEGMTDQIRLWIDRRLRPSPIAAYKAARAILDQEWRDKCAAQGWGKEHWCRDATEAENGKALLPRKEHSDRETALVTECFPGLNILNPETVDTIPKLWVLIVRTIENAEAELLKESEEYCAFRPMLETVYSRLHQLYVPWAFSPPYGEVPDHQLKDRLLYIANRLERGEAGVEESDHSPQISATELAAQFKAFSKEMIAKLGSVEAKSPAIGELSLVPGGFMLGGIIFNLSGRPMRFLEAIHGSRLRRMGIDDLIESMNATDDEPDSPQDIVKEAAKDARAALKKAVKQVGIDCDEPLPSNGRGGDLTYELKIK